MNDMNNERGSNKAIMDEYRKPRSDLKDAILNKILANEQQKKARKRKEKTVMFMYVGGICFALFLLFFLEGFQAVSIKLQLRGLTEYEPDRQDLLVYYQMFTVTLASSIIAFGLYFIKCRRSHNRVDMGATMLLIKTF